MGSAALATAVRRIAPDRVQLNTVTRPPAEDFAYAVPADELARLAPRIAANAEVIADFQGVHERAEFAVGRRDVLELLRRRPCSVDDIAAGLGMHRNEVIKYLEELSAAALVQSTPGMDKIYYSAQDHSHA